MVHRLMPLILILMLGIVLRIPLLFVRGTLSFDELFSVHFATIPSWHDTLKYWTLETNPPLYTLFLRGYLALVGTQSEILIRLPSLVFAILSLIALYIFGKRLFEKNDAMFATLLFALSEIHIAIASEARAYSMLALLAIVSAYLFYRIYHDRETSPRLLVAELIIDTCLLYAHLTSVAFLTAQYITLFVFRADKRQMRRWLAIHGLAIILLLPWLIPSAIARYHANLNSAWFFHPELYAQNANLFTLFLTGFSLNRGDAVTTTLISILLFAGFATVVRLAILKKPIDERILFLSIWAGVPIVASSMLGVYISKYLVITHLALFLLAGRVLAGFCNQAKKTMVACVAILLLLLPATLDSSMTQIFSYLFPFHFIETHETPRTLILAPLTELLPLDRYYRGRSAILPLSFSNTDQTIPRDERIVRENWLLQNDGGAAERDWIERVLSEKYPDRIFLIEGYQQFDGIQNELLNRGWIRALVPNPYRAMKFDLSEFSTPRT